MDTSVRLHNQQVNGQTNYKRCAPIFHKQDHRMHMLIVALDYKRTGRPLDCVTHARNVEELARQCGVHVQKLYDEECTREAVLGAVKAAGAKCRPDDFFMVYFAGHGSAGTDVGESLPSPEADPAADDAIILVDKGGQFSELKCDALADRVLRSVPPETRILLLQDCSHPAAVLDFSRNPRWLGREAAVLAGIQHVGAAQDPSRQGLFTHALLLGIEKLSKVGRDNYSVGMLYNAALYENDTIFGSKQDFVIQTTSGLTSDAMAWPLVPPLGYQAPLSRIAGPGGVSHRADSQLIGVSPEMLQHVKQENLNMPVSIEEYVSQVQGQNLFQAKPCRACTAGCTTNGCAVQ